MASRPLTVLVLIAAACGGAIAGVGSLRLERREPEGAAPAHAGALERDDAGRSAPDADAPSLAVDIGIVRARPPRPGDHWGGCNDARAAGTAPIYRDEPGYRTDMDGDGDGIACEPYRS